MNVNDLPLLELFLRLRKADMPLGIDEYKLVLEALQGGFGISDRASLKRLCRTLWVKSTGEGRLFDYCFDQFMPEPSESELLNESSREQPEISFDSSLPSTLINTLASPLPIARETIATPKITASMEDEIEVAQAVQTANLDDDDIPYLRIISTDEYFPVTRRQMKQSWRYLRRPSREGPPVELDIDSTVKEVGRKGILLKPVLVPRRINRAELLLLVDQGGSMAPFHILSHRLIETALRGGRLGKTSVYYFHNCPVEYIYRDTTHQEYELIEEILNTNEFHRRRVLVFSDAGSARGGMNQERADLTEKFLKQFKQRFPYIVWLNPMPRARWLGTTAEKIIQIVPMFDLSRQGLDNAISVLRGRPTRFETISEYSSHG